MLAHQSGTIPDAPFSFTEADKARAWIAGQEMES